MLYFLQSEVFWVETIIAALITAVVSLLLALIAVGPKLKALGERVKGNKDAMQQHRDMLSKEHTGIVNGIAELKRPVEYLQAMQLKEEGRREQAKGQALDMQKTIDRLLAQQRYVEELEQKVKRLEMENQSLRDRHSFIDEEIDRQRNYARDSRLYEPEL